MNPLSKPSRFCPLSPPPPSRAENPVGRARRRRALAGLLAAGSALLTACSGSLLPQPAREPARLTLDSGSATSVATSVATPVAAPVPADAPVLTVELPRAAPGYDSRQMVYLRQPATLDHFAFHEWVATPAQMLAPMLVRAAQDSGAFRAVLGSPTAVAAGWRLETEGLRLHQDFSQPPSRVRISLRAVLLDSATRQALAWREFDVSVDAASEDPVAGALAAQAAAQRLAAAVAAFCAGQVWAGAAPPR